MDSRGRLADYIRDEKFLPHWNIDANAINFRDQKASIKTEGGFIGYKNAGYIVQNPQTKNFFQDRAIAFWELLMANVDYTIPEPSRFGCRTKMFFPSKISFSKLNNIMYKQIFTENFKNTVGGSEDDLQFTLTLKESGYNISLHVGPCHGQQF